MPDFEITACHANRAGEASVTLRHHLSGAVISIHHIPFQHTRGAPDDVECDGIRVAAAEMGRSAIIFLENTAVPAPIVPAAEPGAAPGVDPDVVTSAGDPRSR
jgi:hypothetical protein